MNRRPPSWRATRPAARLVALAQASLVAGTAVGQIPLGDEALLSERSEYTQGLNSLACDAQAACAAVWSYAEPFDVGTTDWLMGRSFSPQGQLLAERELRVNDGAGTASLMGRAGGFAAVWDRNFPAGYRAPVLQHWSTSLESQGQPIELPYRFPGYVGTFDAAARGNEVVLLWLGPDGPPPCLQCDYEIFVSAVNAAGAEVMPPVRVNEDTSGHERPGGESHGGLAVDGLGNAIVAFRRFPGEPPEGGDLWLRRISPQGVPLGPEVRVNTFLPGNQDRAQVAAGPAGRFVVVWQSGQQDGDYEGIYARLFGADGTPETPEFLVNNVTRSAQRLPHVAMDARENFVVVWQDFEPLDPLGIAQLWDIKARLFRADGMPVGGEFLVNQRLHNEQTGPRVAFAPNGTFLVGWGSNNQANLDSEVDTVARRFAASPGEEVCGVAGPVLACDLGRTGGQAELRRWVGWVEAADGGVPLLGDFAGDGREELCSWRDGLFRCDLDHEGRPIEARAEWGFAGDTPLLGDVDGDGRADPCVRRRRRLLCDTARDGGTAEVRLFLGGMTETPLLGDVDGDGRDDLCLYEAGRWHCAPWAGGELRVRFGAPGGRPALGDLDGDGRSDLCVLEGRRLRCDTDRDGEAEFQLEIEVPGNARLLLGNFDGL